MPTNVSDYLFVKWFELKILALKRVESPKPSKAIASDPI